MEKEISLGTFLKNQRLLLLLTQIDAAAKIGISQYSLNCIELDKKKPRLSTINKMASIYKFNIKTVLEKYYIG